MRPSRVRRQRKGKKCSNDDWHNPHEPDAKVAKLKDGTTHLAHKNEHAVDLETGAIVTPAVHPADEGDPTTLPGTLEPATASAATVLIQKPYRRGDRFDMVRPPSWMVCLWRVRFCRPQR